KSALSRFTPHDFLALVEAHGIAWHEKTLGQLFCDGPARQIVDLLLAECARGQVELQCDARACEVSRREDGFTVRWSDRTAFARSLVIATGGPSIPKMGASGFAYELARQFGLKVVEPRPALVPLTLGGEDVLFRDLSGVATEVIARTGSAAFREAALFTHRGMSGPAILQISSYWRPGNPVSIDFLPQAEEGWLLGVKHDAPRATLRSALRGVLPGRLADTLADRVGLEGPLANSTDAVLRQAEE